MCSLFCSFNFLSSICYFVVPSLLELLPRSPKALPDPSPFLPSGPGLLSVELSCL